MRKIVLSNTDSEMFDTEINPVDYEYLHKHIGAFKRMWEEQKKDFWIRYVMSFRVYHSTYGCIKGKQIQEYTFIIDQGFIYIHEQFLDGKYSHAKNFILDIAVVAQNRHRMLFLDPGNYAKNPFYTRDTRDVFRRLFGQPDSNDSYIKVCLLFPLFERFGGSVCLCLRRWLVAPDMDPDDDSYWTPPKEPSGDLHIESNIKFKDASSGVVKNSADSDQPFQVFWNERTLGEATGPSFVIGWPPMKDPRFFDPRNPLYHPKARASTDWREGVNFLTFVTFIEHCRQTYLKLPPRDMAQWIRPGEGMEKMLLKDKVNESRSPLQQNFWKTSLPHVDKLQEQYNLPAKDSNPNVPGKPKKKKKKKKKGAAATNGATTTEEVVPYVPESAPIDKHELLTAIARLEQIEKLRGPDPVHHCVECNKPIQVCPSSMCQDPNHDLREKIAALKGPSVPAIQPAPPVVKSQELHNIHIKKTLTPNVPGSREEKSNPGGNTMTVTVEKKSKDNTVTKTVTTVQTKPGEDPSIFEYVPTANDRETTIIDKPAPAKCMSQTAIPVSREERQRERLREKLLQKDVGVQTAVDMCEPPERGERCQEISEMIAEKYPHATVVARLPPSRRAKPPDHKKKISKINKPTGPAADPREGSGPPPSGSEYLLLHGKSRIRFDDEKGSISPDKQEMEEETNEEEDKEAAEAKEDKLAEAIATCLRQVEVPKKQTADRDDDKPAQASKVGVKPEQLMKEMKENSDDEEEEEEGAGLKKVNVDPAMIAKLLTKAEKGDVKALLKSTRLLNGYDYEGEGPEGPLTSDEDEGEEKHPKKEESDIDMARNLIAALDKNMFAPHLESLRKEHESLLSMGLDICPKEDLTGDSTVENGTGTKTSLGVGALDAMTNTDPKMSPRTETTPEAGASLRHAKDKGVIETNTATNPEASLGADKGTAPETDQETNGKRRKLRKCSNCQKVESKPKAYRKCQKCKDLGVKNARYYCGRDCQVEDWSNRHKIEHKEKLMA